MQLKTTERIERYAASLEQGAEVTASEVCKALGSRSVTTRKVGGVLRHCETMEFIPLYKTKSGTGKWRRR
jgi:hypothetical protein